MVAAGSGRAADAHAPVAGCTPNNPWELVNAGRHLVPTPGSGVTHDAVAGYEWPLGTLAPGEDAWVGVVVAVSDVGDSAEAVSLALRAAESAGATDPASAPGASAWVAAERVGWDAWHRAETPPPALSPLRLALYRQSTAVLRMAECTEPGPADGEIVASLPPGDRNRAWVRDACYAIAALAASGHAAEARRGLDFLLFRGEAGTYVRVVQGGRDFGVGRPYGISVRRYDGAGREETGANASGS